MARGAVLAFLDADDLWTPQSLARRLSTLSADPELDMAAGHVQQFHSPELDENFTRTIRCSAEPVPGYVMGALLIRKDAFLRVGWFDEGVPAAQGVDWFVRAMEAGLCLRLLPEVVLCRRLHRTNHSHLQIQLKLYPHILKASLDRRRTANQGRAFPLPIPDGSGQCPRKEKEVSEER